MHSFDPTSGEQADSPGGDASHPTEDPAWSRYLHDGEERALRLGNRGPIRFTPEGELAPEIRRAYDEHGFYVFEGVVDAPELRELESDIAAVIERFPLRRTDPRDSQGRPALGADCKAPTLVWAKPLADPFGGTRIANGRHPVKMHEPEAPAEAPDEIVLLVLGPLQFSDACLRLYGHPKLLAVAAAINGADFTPFNETLFLKPPGLGASVAWHQDGTTHWDSPDFDGGCHGFNFMTQLYGSTAANGVWVLPGTHTKGKADIRSLVEQAGSDRLKDAVPIVCGPGDVALCNRQLVHGSFPNRSRDPRITINCGFHRRKSVLGVYAGGVHNARATYDAQRIAERAKILGYAIAARREHYPDEAPFDYAPHREAGLAFAWNEEARSTLHDYNLLDLSI